MGIYDRDYYRREAPSYLEQFLPSGRVCKWLILINVGVFIVQILTTNRQEGISPFTAALWIDSNAVMHGQVWRLLTGAFLHDISTPFHIIFNMLALWWFGSDMERMYGSKEFLAFYLTSAVCASVAYVGVAAVGGHPSYALGASGATTAVMVLCACHFPMREVYIFMMIPAPLFVVVAIYIFADTFVLVSGINTGVAVAAHLGGAIFGFAYYKWQGRLTDLLSSLGSASQRKSRSTGRLRVFRPEDEREPVSVAVANESDLDEHLEAKLDAVLEKVARSGQENLTDGERKILLRASEIYKKRRT